MEENVAVKSYIEDLFRYLEAFEKDYQHFETEAFLQTYNGICAVFQALRKQRENAIAVDQLFLDHIRQGPLTSSDLRQLSIQILITFFEVEADIDGQSNRSYSYVRGLRPVKQDVPFFENNLLPLLFKSGALNNNQRLNAFFLREVARYTNAYGKPLNTGLTPEAFAAMSEPMRFLELQRRRLQMGESLIEDRGSLEFHLQRVEAFNKLSQSSDIGHKHLKNWGYLVESSFWSRVKSALSELGGKIKGAFSSWRYFRLVITQRNPATVFYSVIVILFIVLAIWVPNKWQSYEQERLQQLQERAEQRKAQAGR